MPRGGTQIPHPSLSPAHVRHAWCRPPSDPEDGRATGAGGRRGGVQGCAPAGGPRLQGALRSARRALAKVAFHGAPVPQGQGHGPATQPVPGDRVPHTRPWPHTHTRAPGHGRASGHDFPCCPQPAEPPQGHPPTGLTPRPWTLPQAPRPRGVRGRALGREPETHRPSTGGPQSTVHLGRRVEAPPRAHQPPGLQTRPQDLGHEGKAGAGSPEQDGPSPERGQGHLGYGRQA